MQSRRDTTTPRAQSAHLALGSRDATIVVYTLHISALDEPKMVPRGLEPRTLRLLAVRSDQLSYETGCNMEPESA